jgi:hypothetical protein
MSTDMTNHLHKKQNVYFTWWSGMTTWPIHKYTFVMKLAQLYLPKLRWRTKLEAHISRRSMPNKEFMCRASHTSFAHSNHYLHKKQNVYFTWWSGMTTWPWITWHFKLLWVLCHNDNISVDIFNFQRIIVMEI